MEPSPPLPVPQRSPCTALSRGGGRKASSPPSLPSPAPYATAHTGTQGAAGEGFFFWGVGGGPAMWQVPSDNPGRAAGRRRSGGCRHFPGYGLCSEPVSGGNALRTGQKRGVPGGAAAAAAAASHALPAVGSRRPPGPPLSSPPARRHLTKELPRHRGHLSPHGALGSDAAAPRLCGVGVATPCAPHPVRPQPRGPALWGVLGWVCCYAGYLGRAFYSGLGEGCPAKGSPTRRRAPGTRRRVSLLPYLAAQVMGMRWVA